MSKFICDKCKNEYTGNYCPTCGDKRTKKDEERMTDGEILADVLSDASKTVSKSVKKISKRVLVGSIFLLVSFGLLFMGAYYKSKENDDYKNLTYKYVVNSNYFSGYMSLSGAFLISSILIFVSDKKKD